MNDLIAQSSVDPSLEAELVANANSPDRLIEVANSAWYSVTKDDLLAFVELSDEELSRAAGGFKMVSILHALCDAMDREPGIT